MTLKERWDMYLSETDSEKKKVLGCCYKYAGGKRAVVLNDTLNDNILTCYFGCLSIFCNSLKYKTPDSTLITSLRVELSKIDVALTEIETKKDEIAFYIATSKNSRSYVVINRDNWKYSFSEIFNIINARKRADLNISLVNYYIETTNLFI